VGAPLFRLSLIGRREPISGLIAVALCHDVSSARAGNCTIPVHSRRLLIAVHPRTRLSTDAISASIDPNSHLVRTNASRYPLAQNRQSRAIT